MRKKVDSALRWTLSQGVRRGRARGRGNEPQLYAQGEQTRVGAHVAEATAGVDPQARERARIDLRGAMSVWAIPKGERERRTLDILGYDLIFLSGERRETFAYFGCAPVVGRAIWA